MSFEEFKKHCYHTRMYLVVPALKVRIDKSKYCMSKGKYDFKKETKVLTDLYGQNEQKLIKI